MKTLPCKCGNRIVPFDASWIHAGKFHGPCARPEPVPNPWWFGVTRQATETLRSAWSSMFKRIKDGS